MDQEQRRVMQRRLITGGTPAAVGGAALTLRREQSQPKAANPDILNDDRFDEPQKVLLNKVAAEILFGRYTQQGQLMTDLGLNRDRTYFYLGHLRDNGLIVREESQRKTNIPAHYAATQALAMTLVVPEQYPLLEQARVERVARLQRPSEN